MPNHEASVAGTMVVTGMLVVFALALGAGLALWAQWGLQVVVTGLPR